MTAAGASRGPFRPRLLLLAAVVAALALVLATSVFSASGGAAAALVTASGRHAIAVELADDPRAREVGLMNRNAMPADAGMLFDFKETRPVTMWMKNTYIALDMLFMDEAGVVTRVKANAQPLSLSLIESGGPVRYVLELNGGAAARLGVKAGDRLEHPSIPAAAKP